MLIVKTIQVAPSLEANFYIKFSPEAKIDY